MGIGVVHAHDMYIQTVPNTVWVAKVTTTARAFCLSPTCLFLGRLLFLSVSLHPCLLSSAKLPSSLGLVTALFGTAGTLLNVSKRAQNQGKVSPAYLIMSPYLFIYPPMYLIPASEISYRLLGGDDDGQRPATYWTCTETDCTYLTFLPSSAQLIQHLSQSEPIAPEGFETNSVWYTEKTQ